MRIERSVLSVPGSNWRMIEKGVASDADVAILDLEDAVAPDSKAEGRDAVVRAMNELDWGGKPRTFRMNALDTPFFFRDLIDVVERAPDRVDLIVVPKANCAEDVYVVDTLLTQIEAGLGSTHRVGLEVQIETAQGLINCEAIAQASDRLESIIFGPGDYAASMRIPSESIGVRDQWDELYPGHRFHYPMHRILSAGRAAGLRVIDGPFANYRDPRGHRQSCLEARAMGFDGKWCIHPAQIDPTNEIFSPSVTDLASALEIMQAYQEATESGRGAIALDNRMIDAANIRMARNTVEQARAAGMLNDSEYQEVYR